MFWLDWRSWAWKKGSVKGKEGYSLPAAAELGGCLSAHPPFIRESCFSQEGVQPDFKTKSNQTTTQKPNNNNKKRENCDGGKERRAFSLERAILSLKALEPPPFSCCKHWNSGYVPQVCPRVGSSRSWAATIATQMGHCCGPGGDEQRTSRQARRRDRGEIEWSCFRSDGWL